MTDRIDLDERTDESTTGPDQDGHPDDWIWRDDQAPPTADASERSSEAAPSTPADEPSPSAAGESPDPSPESDTAPTERDTRSIPHVPHPDKGKPAGIPVEGGGSGGGTGTSTPSNTDADADANTAESPGAADDQSASGPHGRGADEMTMAFTFDAIQRVSNPAAVVADASRWTDWLGIVGDVDAHVINKFQRDHGLDLDFFNGTGTGPGDRLAEIDPHSMFFADRMVVVGVAGQDDHVADAVDWEFVPLETAAAEADWELTDTG